MRLLKIGGGNGEISRDYSLLIRGLCCLLVVMHHYANYYHRIYDTDNLFLLFLSKYGGCLGVGVFFFLSGYGVSFSAKSKVLSFAKILKQRYWKLIWPILIVNSVYLAIRYFLGINKYHDWPDLISNFVNIKEIDRALWFIEVLFYCYALFYIYAWLAKKVGARMKKESFVSAIRLAILSLMFGVLTLAVKQIYVERFWYHVNIPMFWLGVVYSEYYKTISRWMTPVATLVLFVAVSALTLYFTTVTYISFANIGCALAAVIIIIGIARKYYIVTAYNSLLGIISLEVYLTHYKLLNLLSHDRTELTISFWVFTGLSLLLGLATYVLFNRRLPRIKKPEYNEK